MQTQVMMEEMEDLRKKASYIKMFHTKLQNIYAYQSIYV